MSAAPLVLAQRRAIRWAIGLVAAVAVWIRFADAETASFVFLGVGLVLLWTGNAVWDWWKLRRGITTAAPDTAAAAAAEAEAIARHQAIITARPARLTYVILGCVAAASALQLGVVDASVDAAGLVKPATRGGEWWRLLTATYLHGGLLHFWMNFGALRALAPLVEAYAPRLRLPLVYLAAGLAGSVASLVLVPTRTSIGASGAILGLAAYLIVLALRAPGRVPPFLRRSLVTSVALTAYLGVFGVAFIDNAGHLGGVMMGGLLGLLSAPRGGAPPRPSRLLDVLGGLALVVIVAGAIIAAAHLLPLRHWGSAASPRQAA